MAFESLITRLTSARGKALAMPTVEGLIKLFEEMGEKNAETIVATIEEFPNVPSNLFGFVKKMWREQKARIESENLWRDKWVSKNEDTTTPGEWNAYFEILTEVTLWHHMGLVKQNPDGITVSCNILEWKRLGCPKTWSPILDHFFEGFLKIHSQPGMACESFMRTYLMLLQNKRLSDRSTKDQDNQETVINNSHVGEGLPVAAGNV
jgi:hypothetical protein